MSKTKLKKSVTAVLLAGGSGARLKGANSPKQFNLILNKPMFVYSLQTYDKIKEIDEIILVINKQYKSLTLKWLKKYKIKKLIAVVNGGRRRHHSIDNALKALTHEGLVLIHNTANPTTSSALIKKCIKASRTHRAVTAYIPAFHTVFIKKTNTITKNISRKNCGYTAEPQIYHVKALKRALKNQKRNNLDHLPMVRLFERLKIPVALVPSPIENFKVTVKSDIAQAESIIRNAK